MNFNQKQTKKEICIPHGRRIMDLDDLRSSLKCCQHCRAGEKKQFFCPKNISTKEKSKWILSFVASIHNSEAIKLTGFPKKNNEVDFTCTSSTHYKTSHMQSTIKSLGLVLKFLGQFWKFPYPLPSITQLFVCCKQQKCFW